MIVRKDIISNVIIENHMDLISHPYFMTLDIMELQLKSDKFIQKTRIDYLYDNKIDRRQLGEGLTNLECGVIQDIFWNLIIKGQVLIVKDINI